MLASQGMKFFNSWNLKSFAILLLFLGLDISFPVKTDQSEKQGLVLTTDQLQDESAISDMECLFEYILQESMAIYQLLPDMDWDKEKTQLENHFKFDYVSQDLPVWKLYPPEGEIFWLEVTSRYTSRTFTPGHGPPKEMA